VVLDEDFAEIAAIKPAGSDRERQAESFKVERDRAAPVRQPLPAGGHGTLRSGFRTDGPARTAPNRAACDLPVSVLLDCPSTTNVSVVLPRVVARVGLNRTKSRAREDPAFVLSGVVGADHLEPLGARHDLQRADFDNRDLLVLDRLIRGIASEPNHGASLDNGQAMRPTIPVLRLLGFRLAWSF